MEGEGITMKWQKRKNRSEGKQRKKIQVNFPIRMQLMIGFLIPILFCVVVGVISYLKASEGLVNNYEKSAMTSLEMTLNSMDVSMTVVAVTAEELAEDQTVYAYALGEYNSDVEKKEQARASIQRNLGVKRTITKMIQDIHVIPVKGVDVITTHESAGTGVKSFVEELGNAPESAILSVKRVLWKARRVIRIPL